VRRLAVAAVLTALAAIGTACSAPSGQSIPIHNELGADAAALALPRANVQPTPPQAAAVQRALAAVASPLRMTWQRAVRMGQSGDPATLPTLEPFSSPVVTDLYGDGRLEVISGGTDGRIHISSAATGAELVRFDVAGQSGTISSQPVIADVNGDGRRDIVTTFMPSARTPTGVLGSTATVAAFTSGGHRIWGVRTCQIPGKNCGVFSSPVVTDLYGNGRREVIVNTFDFRLMVLDAATGRLLTGFPRYLYDTSWSTPAVADLYGDGHKEIISAADLDGDFSCPGLPQIPHCTYGGLVRVFDTAGRQKALFNVPGEVVWSSPAIADVNGDGHPDVVVGTGQYFANVGKPTTPSHRVWALDGRTLRPLAGFPVTLGGGTMSSPAVASVTGGAPWIFINSTDGRLSAIDGTGHVRWAICALYNRANCGRVQAQGDGSPTVADVNGDGRLEVLTVTDRALVVVDAITGQVIQDTALGSGTGLRPFVLQSSPTVVSVDGHASVFLHGTQDATPTGTRDPNDGDYLVRFDSPGPLGAAPWPTFHGQPTHEGTMAPAPVAYARITGLGRYVNHVFADFTGATAPDAAIVSGYQHQLDFGGAAGRRMVAAGPVHSGYWLGGIVDGLYVRILGRAPTPSARADRVNGLARGGSVEALATTLYASDEYLARAGGTPTAFVGSLYTNILGSSPNPARVPYWVGEAAKHGRAYVAEAFSTSLDGRRVRAAAVYDRLLHRAPTASSRDNWANHLLVEDEVGLALELAVSDTYYAAS